MRNAECGNSEVVLMDYKEWLKGVPAEIRADVLWKVTAYRVGLFIADVGWDDVCHLVKDRRTASIADQLYRALCGISPTIAEGYSRGTGKDRARFYEYSLGSTRESMDWYFKSRKVLGEEVVTHRMSVLTHVRRLLLTMIPQQRAALVREETMSYGTMNEEPFDIELDRLLSLVPMCDT